MTFLQFARGFNENFDINSGQDICDESKTALHLAVIHNDIVMVNNLLKDGANPNLVDGLGQSPLELSLRENLTAIAKQILKFSSCIDFKSIENSRALTLSVEKLNVELTEMLLN
jgi:ankyrin repeat protein